MFVCVCVCVCVCVRCVRVCDVLRVTWEFCVCVCELCVYVYAHVSVFESMLLRCCLVSVIVTALSGRTVPPWH